ncbi:MAG: hypothetical protein WCS94_03540 [Verrucomicrobiota bacterium]
MTTINISRYRNFNLISGNTRRIHSVAIVVAWLCLSIQTGVCQTTLDTKAVDSTVKIQQLKSLKELLLLSSADLRDCDIAKMNLMCAEALPGAENIDLDSSLATLEQWSKHIKSETERNHHHFQESPADFYNSEPFYKMLIMAVVLYEDYGIRYNPKLIASPTNALSDDRFFADSSDVFIYGLTDQKHMGTCSSMPVLYVALGRRLGYPLKLVKAKNHLFIRWESSSETFNMDATGKGLERYDDDHFKHWPFPITEDEIKVDGYLKSLSPEEELSVFLSIRGQCLMEASRFDESMSAFKEAYRFAPNWNGNRALLDYAQTRLLENNGHVGVSKSN